LWPFSWELLGAVLRIEKFYTTFIHPKRGVLVINAHSKFSAFWAGVGNRAGDFKMFRRAADEMDEAF